MLFRSKEVQQGWAGVVHRHHPTLPMSFVELVSLRFECQAFGFPPSMSMTSVMTARAAVDKRVVSCSSVRPCLSPSSTPCIQSSSGVGGGDGGV